MQIELVEKVLVIVGMLSVRYETYKVVVMTEVLEIAAFLHFCTWCVVFVRAEIRGGGFLEVT